MVAKMLPPVPRINRGSSNIPLLRKSVFDIKRLIQEEKEAEELA